MVKRETAALAAALAQVIVDAARRPGRFVLTGAQHFARMEKRL